jgi:putative serine/threonine protein kinase
MIYGCSENFIVMEFAEGLTITEWARGQINGRQAVKVIRSTLEQCYALDRVALDHGELSHIGRHVIVNGTKPTIIDFESASTKRKISNVSAAGQSLLVSGGVASALENLLNVDKDAAIGALKKYKRDQTRDNFNSILDLVA